MEASEIFYVCGINLVTKRFYLLIAVLAVYFDLYGSQQMLNL